MENASGVINPRRFFLAIIQKFTYNRGIDVRSPPPRRREGREAPTGRTTDVCLVTSLSQRRLDKERIKPVGNAGRKKD